MKTKVCKILAAIILATVCGCTKNDGDIGHLFGSWLIQEITVDGNIDSSYGGNVVWAFQSSLIRMSVVLPHHQVDNYMGSWSRVNNKLTLNYTYSSSGSASGTGEYGFAPGLHLPENGIVELTVITEGAKSMTLQYDKTDGTSIVYRLSKQF